MLRLAILSVLVALVVARIPRVRPIVSMLDGRIVGGLPTTIEELPYQLSLQLFGSHICGASIISTRKVLTAAHCTDGILATYLYVRANSSFQGTGGQLVGVDSICQHPQFTPNIYDHDVSVLRLSSSLVIGNGAQPIALVDLGQTPTVGSLATVSGWGDTFSPSQLQKVVVSRISQDSCAGAYSQSDLEITDQMICFGYPEGGHSCLGDSGGPLVAGGSQVGVVSWGIGCVETGYPGVYADISSTSIRGHIDSC